jgi:casein kinase 1
MLVNKYKLTHELSSGCFGKIWKGFHIKTLEPVAVKQELKTSVSMLKHESKIHNYLSRLDCVPTLKWFGTDNAHFYMVMPMLHMNIREVKSSHGIYTQEEALGIGRKILNIVCDVHDMQIVHSDIKPDNFMFNTNGQLFIIDFGFARTFCPEKRVLSSSIGTQKYMSRAVHSSYQPRYADDIESVLYVILYLCSEKLPWDSLANYDSQCEKEILFKKNTNTGYPRITKLITCINDMPPQDKPDRLSLSACCYVD